MGNLYYSGVAETTVVTHLRNSRIKLGATNKTHAVVEAIRHSEISVFNKSHGFAPQGSGPFPLATKHGANTNGGSRAPLLMPPVFIGSASRLRMRSLLNNFWGD